MVEKYEPTFNFSEENWRQAQLNVHITTLSALMTIMYQLTDLMLIAGIRPETREKLNEKYTKMMVKTDLELKTRIASEFGE